MIRTLRPNEVMAATVYHNYVVFEFEETQTVIPSQRVVEVNFVRKSEQGRNEVQTDLTID